MFSPRNLCVAFNNALNNARLHTLRLHSLLFYATASTTRGPVQARCHHTPSSRLLYDAPFRSAESARARPRCRVAALAAALLGECSARCSCRAACRSSDVTAGLDSVGWKENTWCSSGFSCNGARKRYQQPKTSNVLMPLPGPASGARLELSVRGRRSRAVHASGCIEGSPSK